MNCTVSNCFAQDIFESLSREVLESNCFDAWANAGFIPSSHMYGVKDTRLLYNQLNLFYCLNQGSYLHTCNHGS